MVDLLSHLRHRFTCFLVAVGQDFFNADNVGLGSFESDLLLIELFLGLGAPAVVVSEIIAAQSCLILKFPVLGRQVGQLCREGGSLIDAFFMGRGADTAGSQQADKTEKGKRPKMFHV